MQRHGDRGVHAQDRLDLDDGLELPLRALPAGYLAVVVDAHDQSAPAGVGRGREGLKSAVVPALFELERLTLAGLK